MRDNCDCLTANGVEIEIVIALGVLLSRPLVQPSNPAVEGEIRSDACVCDMRTPASTWTRRGVDRSPFYCYMVRQALASDTESVPDLAPVPGGDDSAPAADAGDADTDDDLWQVPGMNNVINAATFAAFLASVLHQMQTSDNSPPNDASGNHTS